MFKEFKTFIMRGNVLELAIGIIIGTAFNAIVNSLVEDIIMPPVGLLLGGADFTDLFITLTAGTYATLEEAQAAGAVTINYGVFINTILDFLIVSLTIFLVVRQVNRWSRQKDEEPAPPTTKECPHCHTTIPVKATRCPNCTTELEQAA